MYIPNRWPGLPGGRAEVVLHSPEHDSSFPSMGRDGAVRVVELWSARTAALGAPEDVGYVFVFENKGRLIGATIDHPHSQILAIGLVPPIAGAELARGTCDLCRASPVQTLLAIVTSVVSRTSRTGREQGRPPTQCARSVVLVSVAPGGEPCRNRCQRCAAYPPPLGAVEARSRWRRVAARTRTTIDANFCYWYRTSGIGSCSLYG
jgi:hypothetical protein